MNILKKRASPICFKQILRIENKIDEKSKLKQKDLNKFYSENVFSPEKYYKPILY